MNLLPRRRMTVASAVAILIVLLAFGLRIYRLDYQGIWGDEYVSFRHAASELPPDKNENLQLFYYAVVQGLWPVLIPNVFGLRWPSMLSGVLAVAASYQATMRLGGRRAGLLAALFLAVSPMHIHRAQEARMYAVIVLLAFVTLWTLTLLGGKTRWAHWAYPLSVGATVATHMLAALWLAVLGGILLVRQLWADRKPGWRTWLAGQVVLVAVSGALFVLQNDDSRSWIQIPPPDFLERVFRLAVGLRFRQFDVLSGVWQDLAQWTLFLLVLAGLLRLVRQSATPARPLSGSWVAALLGLSAAIPVAIIVVASYWVRPLWVDRYMMPSLASTLLLVAVCVGALRRRLLRVAAVAIVLTSSLALDLNYYFNPWFQLPDWASAARYITERLQPGDVLLTSRNTVRTTFFNSGGVIQFYLRDVSLDVKLLTNPLVDGDEAAEQFHSSAEEYERVWVMLPSIDAQMAEEWVSGVEEQNLLLERAEFRKISLFLFEAGPP